MRLTCSSFRDGGISEDDAEATEGAGRSYETENENIRAGRDTRTARSDDDDDFQAGTSVLQNLGSNRVSNLAPTGFTQEHKYQYFSKSFGSLHVLFRPQLQSVHAWDQQEGAGVPRGQANAVERRIVTAQAAMMTAMVTRVMRRTRVGSRLSQTHIQRRRKARTSSGQTQRTPR